jgi:hypothetical protein
MDPNNPDTYLEITPKCPFCGGDPEWRNEWNGLYHTWHVACQNDNCRAQAGSYGNWESHGDAQTKALAMWNRRTPEAQAQTQDAD